MRRQLAGWRARTRALGERWQVIRREWQVERDLEQVVSGQAPIVAGPWLSEVGYEVLYWVPFLRWVAAAYRIPPQRMVVMSRGGTDSWYSGLASRYVDVFDHAAPADLASRAAEGQLKQRDISPIDRRLVAAASNALHLGPVRLLHPSLMFRWFAPFWSGHEGVGFVERHARFATLTAPDVELPLPLPEEYAVVKFYSARALPDTPQVRGHVRDLTAALAERWPIVQLDTGLVVDEHADYRMGSSDRLLSVAGQLSPRTNLAAQTRIIAGAKVFVGTCGSLAWLAPLLGVDTVPVFTDASFLHAHLHLARRVYGRLGAAQFTPLDLTGVLNAGLSVAGAGRTAAAPVS
jgi:hypothetical protein